MAEESEKVEKTATEHEQDLIKHGMEVSLPEAEARAEEQRKIQEEAEAARKRQAALLFDYFQAGAEKKELDKKLEELKKLIHFEMDEAKKNMLRAEPYIAMRTQKSKTSIDQDLLKTKVEKVVLDTCYKTSSYWELKVGKEE